MVRELERDFLPAKPSSREEIIEFSSEKLPPLAPLAEVLRECEPQPRRILLVRCAPEGLVREALSGLRQAFPGAEITLLCQPGHEIAGFESLVNPGHGFFRLEDLDRETLRSSKFELVLVPCSTIRRLAPSYYNIDAIVAATGALQVVYFYSDRQAVLVDPEFLELKERHLIRPFMERKRETIAELAQYTGESPETVERKCESAGLRAIQLWHQRAPRTEEEIRRYYQENDFYLYELMKTEYNGDEAEISAEVVSLCRPEERVLEYGGGGGTLSIALAGKGCRVTHLDLPGPLLEFAAWRHRRRGLMVRSWPLVDESVLGGPYDTVVSLYVLEHLAAPERTLQNLHSALAPGGRLMLAVDYEESTVKDCPLPLHLNRISRERCHEVIEQLGLTHTKTKGDLEIYIL